MFTTLISATLLSAAFAFQSAFAQFSIYTIELNQCAPAHVTWSEAQAPYNLAVVPVEDPCNTVLVDLGDHDGLSMTWYNVTLAKGTKVMFSLLDSSDQEAWSGEMTVGDGDGACLPGASSDAAPSATNSSSSAPPATTLTLTSSFSRVSSAPTEAATIVGAANAGTLGDIGKESGALSSVRLPAAATVLASLVAIAATLAL